MELFQSGRVRPNGLNTGGIGGGFQAGYVFSMITFFALPKEQAVATSLIAWASSSVPIVVAGFFYMISQGLSMKDLKAVPAEQ